MAPFHEVFSNKTWYPYPVFSVLPAFLIHIILLDCVILTTFCVQYESRSPLLCSFLQLSLDTFVFDPNLLSLYPLLKLCQSVFFPERKWPILTLIHTKKKVFLCMVYLTSFVVAQMIDRKMVRWIGEKSVRCGIKQLLCNLCQYFCIYLMGLAGKAQSNSYDSRHSGSEFKWLNGFIMASGSVHQVMYA